MACHFTPRALPDADYATADLINRHAPLVTRRLRNLIERFEPGGHRFTPQPPAAGSAIERFAIEIGQAFDSVSPEHSTWVKQSGVLWRPAGSIDSRLVFDTRLIAGRHLWENSGLGSDRPYWASDALMAAARDEGMTGLLFDPHAQTDAGGGYQPPPRALDRVYQLSCPAPMRPNNPHVPLTIKARALDGDRLKISFADPGATGIRSQPGLAHGFAVDPTHVPTRVEYFQNVKGLPVELFASGGVPLSVTARFRDIVERFEPGRHQFLPIDFVDKKGAPIQQRFVFVVCNQIDSVSRDHTQMLFDRMWHNPRGECPKIVYDKAAIGDRHVWRDKRLSGEAILYSAALTEAVHVEGFDDIRYAHWEMR